MDEAAKEAGTAPTIASPFTLRSLCRFVSQAGRIQGANGGPVVSQPIGRHHFRGGNSRVSRRQVLLTVLEVPSGVVAARGEDGEGWPGGAEGRSGGAEGRSGGAWASRMMVLAKVVGVNASAVVRREEIPRLMREGKLQQSQMIEVRKEEEGRGNRGNPPPNHYGMG